MTLPTQFIEENPENIRVYHYVEELIQSYRKYMRPQLENNEISLTECPFLIRLRFSDKNTQQDLAKIFKVSEGYTAKLLRKFEDKGYITRRENPENRREKIVTLTEKGILKTDELTNLIDGWEQLISKNIEKEEYDKLKQNLYKMVNENHKENK